MADLSSFPITQRWPATDPDIIQLYTLGTPNGFKVSIMLEETDLPYEAHRVSFAANDQMSPEFLSLNPNNKIPAIIDPTAPGGPLALWESGAILVYLAEKTGALLPSDAAQRAIVMQWLMFQMGGIGPMFGQFGHFYKFAADKITDPYPADRYLAEVRRILGILDRHLDSRDFVAGKYSIADIAIVPWLRGLSETYGATDIIGLETYANVSAYASRVLARPAVQRGLKIPR